MKRLCSFLLVILAILCSCSQNSNDNKATNSPNISQVSHHQIDQSDAKKAEKIVEKMDTIPEVIAVNTEKDLLIAYRINHLSRFTLKETDKKIKKKLKKTFKDKEYKITVSHDIKVILETEKLVNDLPNLDKKKLNKKVKKIIELSKEEA
ncbi:YhcN/YlaJ family sporulation lipoprotein [Bacillus sp. FJAT-47783]|uniref:YhcN/YlaJ family sporulation lipoprotein n=1 Tax=Bacillus sp. FJAT-47783 TaxID=2922712 RepID=UPI001FADF3E6|nr:YhcN/YlaJ family sporulation lipoprotein [Bacillus sp. FJAT-47783]